MYIPSKLCTTFGLLGIPASVDSVFTLVLKSPVVCCLLLDEGQGCVRSSNGMHARKVISATGCGVEQGKCTGGPTLPVLGRHHPPKGLLANSWLVAKGAGLRSACAKGA